MPLLIIASTLIIYSSPSLALLISNQRHQPRFQTARVASRAATRADDYETSAENWWRVHRIDRLKSVSESADVQNPLLLEGHIHPTYFVKDGEVSHLLPRGVKHIPCLFSIQEREVCCTSNCAI